MARIPEAELEALKSQIDLVALIQSKGIVLKKHGKDLAGRCPFHDDKTPSLVVTPEKNLWHCMGACQTGGGVIDWIMKCEGVNFRHAVEILRDGNPAVLLRAKVGPRQHSIPLLSSPITDEAAHASDAVLLGQVIEYYHTRIFENEAALSYLAARGIEDQEAIRRFKIGFSDRTLGVRIPQNNRLAGASVRERLESLGVLRGHGHEHFAGSIVFPVFDQHGGVTEIYGRKITPRLREGSSAHTYLPGPHKGVWNWEGVQAAGIESRGELILCEAIIDALTFWVNGFKNVTAAYGIEGFTGDHLEAILSSGIKRVLIAFDRDEAGDRGAEKVAARLASEGIAVARVLFPKGMDANAYALQVKPPAQAIRVCIESAEPMKVKVAARPFAPILDASFSLAAASTPLEESKPTEPLEVAPRPADVPTEVRGEEVYVRLGDREYRVRGLFRNSGQETMKINLRVSIGLKNHIDTIDLYQAKGRVAFIQAVERELGIGAEVVKRDLGRLLWKCEELQEVAAARRGSGESQERTTPQMTAKEEAEALTFLRSPDLLPTILADFEACGVIGEETNKLVGYLAAVSRKLEDPLAVVIQSTSAAGKSSLMESILAMVPPEDRVKYSAMTGQSLFYMGEKDLKHRVLAIAEEQGARNAAYALKLLQSEGEISIASTGKDATTGKLVTHEYRVEGPVMLFMTTTAPEMDEELLNRCLVLAVDEDRAQTRAIHERQRKGQTLEGLLLKRGKAAVVRKHQNAQRLLRSLLVANPFATELEFADSHTRARRDHVKYLALIRTIALLHQHQRAVKSIEHSGEILEYIEVERSDIEVADRLFAEVSGRFLDDLPPQARRLLTVLTERVAAEVRFTRREVRAWMGWSDCQVQVHLNRLVRQEHVTVYRGGSAGTALTYSLTEAGHGMECDLTQSFEHPTHRLMGGPRPHLALPVAGENPAEMQGEIANAAPFLAVNAKAHRGSKNNDENTHGRG
ncbi:MAG: hypothetical protein A2X94_13205 [Bdellovibrionales bacterium GWB1_55_8]|nr:MAG: hypothetical protein A2X94_13205 [Bdellovibrionales bacterium GWB1_55_8]